MEEKKLIFPLLYGKYDHKERKTGDDKADKTFNEVDAAVKEANDNFRKMLYELMIIHNTNSVFIDSDGIRVFLSQNQLRRWIGDDEAAAIEDCISSLFQSGYVVLDDIETDARRAVNILMIEQKFAILAIMKKYDLEKIDFKYFDKDALSPVTRSQLESEISEKDLQIYSGQRRWIEGKYKVKLEKAEQEEKENDN